MISCHISTYLDNFQPDILVNGPSMLVPYLHTIAYHSHSTSHILSDDRGGTVGVRMLIHSISKSPIIQFCLLPKVQWFAMVCNFACTDCGIAYMHICANVHACNAIAILHCSVLREWTLEVRKVKSEMKICCTHFEK